MDKEIKKVKLKKRHLSTLPSAKRHNISSKKDCKRCGGKGTILKSLPDDVGSITKINCPDCSPS